MKDFPDIINYSSNITTIKIKSHLEIANGLIYLINI